jgi:hypothetical protein
MHQFTIWAYCTADFSSISSVGSAASQFFINAKNKKYVELKYRQIMKYSRRSRYGYCTIIHKEERFICGK